MTGTPSEREAMIAGNGNPPARRPWEEIPAWQRWWALANVVFLLAIIPVAVGVGVLPGAALLGVALCSVLARWSTRRGRGNPWSWALLTASVAVFCWLLTQVL
jgi:hypothetical protein